MLDTNSLHCCAMHKTCVHNRTTPRHSTAENNNVKTKCTTNNCLSVINCTLTVGCCPHFC